VSGGTSKVDRHCPVVGLEVRVSPGSQQGGHGLLLAGLGCQHQGGGPVLGPQVRVARRPARVATIRQQQRTDPTEAPLGCQHEGCQPVLIPADCPGAVLEQVADDPQPVCGLRPGPPHGGVERGLPPDVAVPHPGSPPDQPADHGQVCLYCGVL